MGNLLINLVRKLSGVICSIFAVVLDLCTGLSLFNLFLRTAAFSVHHHRVRNLSCD